MAARVHTFSFSGWSWSAVVAGAITSLVFQVLLVMIGYGLGLLTIDVPTADTYYKTVSWAVFCWWAVSGVISAFAGGWIAAQFSPSFTPEARATHGLMAWAIAMLIVVGAAGFAASNSVAGSLGGPTATVMAQYRTLTEPRAAGQSRPTQAQLEEARRSLALAMIASFVALLVGAGAAVAGSEWLPETSVRGAVHPTGEQRSYS